jgi:hypothetical protein
MWGELTTRITLVSVLLSMSCSSIAQVGDPGGGEGIDFRAAIEQTLQKNPALYRLVHDSLPNDRTAPSPQYMFSK